MNTEEGFSYSSLNEEKLTEIWGLREISSGVVAGLITGFDMPITESTFNGMTTEWIFTDSQGNEFKCVLRGTTGTCAAH